MFVLLCFEINPEFLLRFDGTHPHTHIKGLKMMSSAFQNVFLTPGSICNWTGSISLQAPLQINENCVHYSFTMHFLSFKQSTKHPFVWHIRSMVAHMLHSFCGLTLAEKAKILMMFTNFTKFHFTSNSLLPNKIVKIVKSSHMYILSSIVGCT